MCVCVGGVCGDGVGGMWRKSKTCGGRRGIEVGGALNHD